jgi:hypothetical protein
MTKIRKLAVLAILAMVIALMPAQLFAANADANSLRLAGDDRHQTALQISYAGWDKAETVILAPSNQANLVDALAAAPLAGQLGAPILLTPVDRLDSNVKARLVTLGAKKVYVVGAIADSVTAEVEAMNNVTAVALKGSNRCDTAAQINGLLTNPQGTFVVGHAALADALSVASFAAKNRYAVIVADASGRIPAGQQALGKKTYLIGGPGLVAADVEGTRIYGQDRFETNLEVAKALSFNYERVYVANGHQSHLVDSLAVAPLAAQFGAFVALADDLKYEIKAASFVNTKVTKDSKIIAVGGTQALSDSLKTRLGTAKTEEPQSVSKAPKGIAPNQVEFRVNRLLSGYSLDKITLGGNLITQDSAGQNQVHPKSVALANDVLADECVVTLTLYGEVADTSFKSAASISLAKGAFTTILGIETEAKANFITSFEDYSRPADLRPGAARTYDEDGDGLIDAIAVTYSEALNTPSVTAADYEVEGYVVKDVNVQGKTVLVRINEIGDSSTALKITQVGEVADDSPQRNVLGPQGALTTVDGVAPAVSGVRNLTAYNEDVTPVFTEGTAVLSKDGGAAVPFVSGTVIAAEGSYVLTVTDDASNTATVNFIIDKTKPTVDSTDFDAGDLTKVTVTFSEPVLAFQAENPANYVFTDFSNGGVTIVSIVYDGAAHKAIVTLSGDHGVGDTLTVKPGTIHDPAGNAVE